MGKNDPWKGSSKYAYKDTTKFPFPSYAKARLCFVCLEKKKESCLRGLGAFGICLRKIQGLVVMR